MYEKTIILLLLVFIPLTAHTEEQVYSLTGFSGYVDLYSPDQIGIKNSPDLLNVRTDGKSVWKRLGYDNYNATALNGALKGRNLYLYKKANGSQYLIANSSNSMFADTTGTEFTAIKSGLSATLKDDYTTVKDTLYRDNGSDTPGKWDGTTYTSITAAVSTNVVVGKYIKWYHNRLWKAGVTGSLSVVYYSEVNDPDNFNANNYINVTINDGDILTGLFVWGDKLIATKRYSMWEIVETQAGNFIIRALNMKVGCLYQSTIAELFGFPIWMSARGIEYYTGANIELISKPIENLIERVGGIASNQRSFTETSGADWSSFTSIDNFSTSTVLGSIVSTCAVKIELQNPNGTTMTPILTVSTQGVIVTTDAYISKIRLNIYEGVDFPDTTMYFRIGSIAGTVLSTITFASLDTGIAADRDFNITPPILLSSGTLYVIHLINESWTQWRWEDSGDTLPNVRSDRGANDYRFAIYMYDRLGSYTSSISTCQTEGATWRKWGAFEVNDVKVGTATVNYAVYTATSTNGIWSGVSVINGQTINSSTNPYVKVQASFDTTIASDTVTVNDYTVKWTEDGAFDEPIGFVYKDDYYLAVSTESDSLANDTVLVYQTLDKSWTIFNNMSIGGATIKDNDLYTIDGNDTGFVYRQDIDNTYNDNGSAYNSYWTSKNLDFDNVIVRKQFSSLWAIANNSGNWNLVISYRLGGFGTWNNFNINLNENSVVVAKRPFPLGTKHRFIQYKISNNNINEYFKVKALHTLFSYSTDE